MDDEGDADFVQIDEAIYSLDTGAYGIIVVHEGNNGSYGYAEVVVDQGKVVALLAADGEVPLVGGDLPFIIVDPIVSVQGAETALYVSGLVIDGDAFEFFGDGGVVVDGALAWIDNSRVVGAEYRGVLVQNEGSLVLRNSFIDSAWDTVGIEIDHASVDILYSTVAIGTNGPNVSAIDCISPVSVNIRNSIVVSHNGLPPPGEILCPEARVVNSATEQNVGEFDYQNDAWFEDFFDGDFHLTVAGSLIFGDMATWEVGDPTTDIDGDLRPNVPGSPDYAGADVP